jgi:(4S)-4-hydroxy-5-phosphonooxypentane-2,3-dione isomerase
MSTPYINAVELDIVPVEYEKFKVAILENAAASVKEPGCRQFDVLFEDNDPHHVFLYEVYDDATALEAHRATAHFKKYLETTASMIAKRVARHMSPIAFNIKRDSER